MVIVHAVENRTTVEDSLKDWKDPFKEVSGVHTKEFIQSHREIYKKIANQAEKATQRANESFFHMGNEFVSTALPTGIGVIV